MHVETRLKTKDIDLGLLSKLPSQLFIIYSIQYKDLASKIKKELSKKHKIIGFKQVLGCTKLKTKYPILLIADGLFHAINIGLQNNSAIYIYTGKEINQLDRKIIKKLKAKQKAALSNFYMAKKIGILVSTKPGQNRMQDALKLKKRLEAKNKQAYVFIADNLDLGEIENFSIDSWVNTACPGLARNMGKIVNIDDIIDF